MGGESIDGQSNRRKRRRGTTSDTGEALTGFPGKTVVGAAALESIATDIEEGFQMRQVEPMGTASIVVVEMWAAVGHQGISHMGSLVTSTQNQPLVQNRQPFK